MAVEFLTTEQTAKRLQLSRRALQCMRKEGRGPTFVALSRKLIRYPARELDAWIERHVVRPEAA